MLFHEEKQEPRPPPDPRAKTFQMTHTHDGQHDNLIARTICTEIIALSVLRQADVQLIIVDKIIKNHAGYLF